MEGCQERGGDPKLEGVGSFGLFAQDAIIPSLPSFAPTMFEHKRFDIDIAVASPYDQVDAVP
jgi:hypothetical protein